MKNQVLMLSVAVAALCSVPAFADPDPLLDITTALTAPVTTATANTDGTPADIKLDTGGSITITAAGPAVTINSNNSFEQLTGTTISNKNTTSAVGILVDLTTAPIDATNDGCTTDCAHSFEGLIENGILDLSGTGTAKRGVWFQGAASDSGVGPFTFTGNIDMTGSTMTITGDGSIGVLIDQEAIVNGTITLGSIDATASSTTAVSTGVVGFDNEGVINGDFHIGFDDVANNVNHPSLISATGTSDQTSSGIVALKLDGTINGDFLLDTGSAVTALGNNAEAIFLSGNIAACDQIVTPGCTSTGSFTNKGQIAALGSGTLTAQTGNPGSGIALAIGGDIAGGFVNFGPQTNKDTATTAALISSRGTLPAIEISPAFQSGGTPTSIAIGYASDTVDPGFSFYNRGSITSSFANYGESNTAFFITGSGDATATLTGGLFNSNSISSTVITSSTSKSAVTAQALVFGSGAVVGAGEVYTYGLNGCDCMVYNPQNDPNAPLKNVGDQAALVNSDAVGAGSGTIIASVTGPTSGNSATAITINSGAVLPSIINSGIIEAASLSSDTTVKGLKATAIMDASSTLTYILNNGAIEAIATKLDDNSQQTFAIDLHGDNGGAAANGVEIDNRATSSQSATILGDIWFGTGDHQIINDIGNDTVHIATIAGDITFGGGGVVGSDELNISHFASLTGTLLADSKVGVTVNVGADGTLTITNDTTALNAAGFHVQGGGTLNVTVSEDFTSGIIDASQIANGYVALDAGAKLNIVYGSFVPTNSTFILFKAPTGSLSVSDTLQYNTQLLNNLPFLFSSAVLDTHDNGDGTSIYRLTVNVKDATDLGLTGYAAQMLPFANQALAVDDKLGGAMVMGIVDKTTAQKAYAAFAPNVTGGARAIAMSLTDQATGPVAARQRILRMYGKDSGDITLWGQEFAEFVKDPGDTSSGQTGFKDHGFGFVLGMDGGTPKTGWYGGALTFYSGDIVEPFPRDSHSNTNWYMLTGYTDWRGKGLFLDTKVDVGYVMIKQKRFIDLVIPPPGGTGSPTSFSDEADSRHPGLVGSAGFTTGVILNYGATTFTPQLSVDAMTLREEGFAESHPTTASGNGKGFDLTANSSYANSARVFIGADVRHDLDFGDFFIQPDVRLGYRYDFLNDPAKLTAHFTNISPNPTGVIAGPNFTIEGPDPSQGNVVAGASLSATTDAWTLGLNFDYVRGTNGATTEVGTIHLLGRI